MERKIFLLYTEGEETIMSEEMNKGIRNQR